MSTAEIAACADVVIHLHERGYVHDFAMVGNKIWWAQENCFLSRTDLTILECHDITPQLRDHKASVIFGLIANRYDAKGILINHVDRVPAGRCLKRRNRSL